MKIRALNDLFRTTFIGGQVMLTSGIQSLNEQQQSDVLTAVRQFKNFDALNDPHGEHDFAFFKVDGTLCFFKLDYYDYSMEFGSENPADPTETKRVLTIGLAEEY